MNLKASFIIGLLNSWELLTLKGEKLQMSAREFLMVGFLNSGEPLTLFLAKAILSIVTGGAGGCNVGLGLVSIIITGVAAKKLFKRKK